MIVVRYVYDLIVGFQHHEDAQRLRKELGRRLQDFGLEMNEQKSRFIRFGRYAEQQNKELGLEVTWYHIFCTYGYMECAPAYRTVRETLPLIAILQKI